jgi:hypothetical protein
MLLIAALLANTPAVNKVVLAGKFVVAIPVASTPEFISKIFHSILN